MNHNPDLQQRGSRVTLTLNRICSLDASVSPVYTTHTTCGNSFCTSRIAVQSTLSPPPPALLFLTTMSFTAQGRACILTSKDGKSRERLAHCRWHVQDACTEFRRVLVACSSLHCFPLGCAGSGRRATLAPGLQ